MDSSSPSPGSNQATSPLLTSLPPMVARPSQHVDETAIAGRNLLLQLAARRQPDIEQGHRIVAAMAVPHVARAPGIDPHLAVREFSARVHRPAADPGTAPESSSSCAAGSARAAACARSRCRAASRYGARHGPRSSTARRPPSGCRARRCGRDARARPPAPRSPSASRDADAPRTPSAPRTSPRSGTGMAWSSPSLPRRGRAACSRPASCRPAG